MIESISSDFMSILFHLSPDYEHKSQMDPYYSPQNLHINRTEWQRKVTEINNTFSHILDHCDAFCSALVWTKAYKKPKCV